MLTSHQFRWIIAAPVSRAWGVPVDDATRRTIWRFSAVVGAPQAASEGPRLLDLLDHCGEWVGTAYMRTSRCTGAQRFAYLVIDTEKSRPFKAAVTVEDLFTLVIDLPGIHGLITDTYRVVVRVGDPVADGPILHHQVPGVGAEVGWGDDRLSSPPSVGSAPRPARSTGVGEVVKHFTVPAGADRVTRELAARAVPSASLPVSGDPNEVLGHADTAVVPRTRPLKAEKADRARTDPIVVTRPRVRPTC